MKKTKNMYTVAIKVRLFIGLLLFFPISSQATETSGLFIRLIQTVNSYKAASSPNYAPNYALAESPGYNYYRLEDLGQSKKSLQKLLSAGHKYKDRYNRIHNSIPGYPSSKMERVKMSISDLLGSISYSDLALAEAAKNLGFKGKVLDQNKIITANAQYFIEEQTLNLTTFKKVLRALEPNINPDKFKYRCNIFF